MSQPKKPEGADSPEGEASAATPRKAVTLSKKTLKRLSVRTAVRTGAAEAGADTSENDTTSQEYTFYCRA